MDTINLENITDLHDASSAIDKILDQLFKETKKVDAEQLGLDKRSCYGERLIIDACEGYIAVHHNDLNSIMHYGGFEYIDADSITKIGDYTFFMIGVDDEGRVSECFDHLKESE
tara:strand:+ start:60 stop:401 length:342 start_codon:yes stop_codon:yes gene_type:complete